MVEIEKVRNGICNYIDKYILAGYTGEGWKKVVVPAAAAVLINSYIDKYLSNEFLIASGVVSNGMVEIDPFAEEIKKRISETGLNIKIPMLGDATFHKNDVDEIVRMIKEGY